MRVAPERPAAGQQLVEDDAQAEDVRAAIDPVPLAPGLLGAHVGRRPGEPGSLAEVLVPQRQPEVGHVRLAVEVDQDVGRLDVPVDQVPRMGMVQRLGDRRHQLGRLPEGRTGPAASAPPGWSPRCTWRPRSRGRRRCGRRRGPARCWDGRAWRGSAPRPGRPRRPRGRRLAPGWAP